MISFLADYSPTVGTCNVYLHTNDEEGDVYIHETKIVFDSETEEYTFSLPRGVLLVRHGKGPTTKTDGWTCFKAFVQQKPIIVSCVLEQLTDELEAFRWVDKVAPEKAVENQKITCNCRRCDASITKFMNITKYCSLPSVDFTTASENWFCCNHGTRTANMPSALIPKPNEIFHSEFFYCIHPSNLLGKSEKEIFCSLCKSELGVLDDQTLRLWSNEVKLTSEGKVLIEKTERDMVVSLCEELEKDSFGLSAKIVYSDEKSGKYLVLVVMDLDQTLLLSNDSPLLNSSEAEISLSMKKVKKTSGTWTKLVKKKCLKMLYSVEEKEDPEWHSNNRTFLRICSPNFFIYLKKMLEITNSCLPLQYRVLSDLNVGYILK